MPLRFSLKRLLIVVAMVGVLFAVATQIGMVESEFEVWENNLRLNSDGLVQGDLRLGFESELYGEDAWPVEFKINNVSDGDLLGLQEGTKNKIKHRAKGFGPLKVQEPCQLYLTRVLGLDADSIVGYVSIKGRTEVVIDGNR